MSETLISTVYHTGKQGDTFRNCFTLSYFGPFVFIQALSGVFTRECRKELHAFFTSEQKKHLTTYWYIRKKRGRFIVFRKELCPNSPAKPGLFILKE